MEFINRVFSYVILCVLLFSSCKKEEIDNYVEFKNYEKANILENGMPVVGQYSFGKLYWEDLPPQGQPLLINSLSEFEFLVDEDYSIDKSIDFDKYSVVVTRSYFLPTLKYYEYDNRIFIDSISKNMKFQTLCNQYGNKIDRGGFDYKIQLLDLYVIPKITDEWSLINTVSIQNLSGKIDLSEYAAQYIGELKRSGTEVVNLYSQDYTKVEVVELSINTIEDDISKVCFSFPVNDSAVNLVNKAIHLYSDKVVLNDWDYAYSYYNSDDYTIATRYCKLNKCMIYNERAFISFMYDNPDTYEEVYFEFVGEKDKE